MYLKIYKVLVTDSDALLTQVITITGWA